MIARSVKYVAFGLAMVYTGALVHGHPVGPGGSAAALPVLALGVLFAVAGWLEDRSAGHGGDAGPRGVGAGARWSPRS